MSTLWEWRKLAWFGIIVFTLFSLLNLFHYTKNVYQPRTPAAGLGVANTRSRLHPDSGHLRTIVDMLCPNSSTLCTERLEINGREELFSDFSEKLREHVEMCIEKLREFPPVTYSYPLLTLFTTWDYHDHKPDVHENTVRNWLALGPAIEVVVFSASPEVKLLCEQVGCKYQPSQDLGGPGVPVLKTMYLQVEKLFDSFFYAYANADILFEGNLVKTLERVLHKFNNTDRAILIVGQRTNVMNVTREEAVPIDVVTKIAFNRGTLFRTDAEDYFITSKAFNWRDIPSFIVGSPAYDNWLVAYSIQHSYVTIDATRSIVAVHQTTTTGNYEGHHKRFADYNVKLLKKIRSRVNVQAGHTICTQYYTQKDFCGLTELMRRKPNPCSKPKSSRRG